MPLRRFVAFAAIVAALVGPGPAVADPPSTELDRQIRAAAQQLESVIEEYHSLREDLRITAAQSRILGAQIGPLEGRVDQIRERIAAVASTAYKTSGVSGVNVLLAASNGPDFIRRLDVLDLLARQRQAEIATLYASRDQYLAARRTLDALATQQRDQEAELATRKAAIEREVERLRIMRLRAHGYGERAGRSSLRDLSVPAPPGGLLGAVVRFAAGQLGKSYRFAADGPDSYDCSGLVVAAYRGVGVDLPHSSRAQWDRVRRISRAELRPGDLVFYYSDIHHVAIYVGGDKMIHAPQYGEPVRVDPVDHAPVHGFGRPR